MSVTTLATMTAPSPAAARIPSFGAPALPGFADPRKLRGEAARKARQNQVFGNLTPRAYEDLVFRLRTITGSVVLVSDPVGVKRVLVDNVANYPKSEMEQRFFRALFGDGLVGTEGDLWRRHRRIMAPAFDPRSVASYGPAITRACDAFYAQWDAVADGGIVDLPADMSGLTLRIIAGTMFSADTDDVIGLVADTMKDGFDISQFNILDILPITGPIRMRRRERRMAEQFRPLDAAIGRMIAAREKDQGRRCDLEAGMAKLLGARVAWAAADNAVQIHGGTGFAVEQPVSRLLADARILNIFEGAGEIQAQVIARRLLDGAN